MITIILTVLAVLLAQKLLVSLAQRDSEREWLDTIYGYAYRLCDRLGLAIPYPEPEDVEGLVRYSKDGPNPFLPFVTKIVVPDEYSRHQVMLALRYLHDGDIDTDYMAVNHLVHCYTDETGEPTGVTPWIVIEPEIDFEARVERAAYALERARTSGYGWSDKQFDTLWNRDLDFTTRVTAWGDGFRGTKKDRVKHEARLVLQADQS